MEAAFEHGHMEELARLAHWLKGSGGTVGYDDFTEPAALLEETSKAGNVKQAGNWLKQVIRMTGAIVPPDACDFETSPAHTRQTPDESYEVAQR